MFNKELEDREQTEINNTITEMNNTLEASKKEKREKTWENI